MFNPYKSSWREKDKNLYTPIKKLEEVRVGDEINYGNNSEWFIVTMEMLKEYNKYSRNMKRSMSNGCVCFRRRMNVPKKYNIG